MYSTSKNIVATPPTLYPGRTCGKYLQYPASLNRRKEFGMRLHKSFKTNKHNLPLVTIITVVLNRHNTIEKCLLSVLGQSYENIEYLVIDGGSTDGTTAVIERYSSNIDYCISENDIGIYNAINKGLSLATGKYILVLNSDDWYPSKAVSELVETALSTSADVTHANAYTVNNEGDVIGVLKGWLHQGLYTRGMPVRHETMLIKNSVYNEFGYYSEEYSILSDYVYLVDLYTGKCTFSHINKPLLYFNIHGTSYIDNNNRIEERSRFINEMFPFVDQSDVDLLKTKRRMGMLDRLHLVTKYWRHKESKLFINSLLINIFYSLINFGQLPTLLVKLAKSTWHSISRLFSENK